MYVNVNSLKGEWFKPEKIGDYVEGDLVSINHREGAYGKQDFLVIDDNGINKFVSLTAGLSFIDFEELKGERIKIVYNGTKTNPKTKRIFKDFNVMRYTSPMGF